MIFAQIEGFFLFQSTFGEKSSRKWLIPLAFLNYLKEIDPESTK